MLVNPYSGDPFSVLIIDRLHLTPVLAALGILVLMLLVDAITFRAMGYRILALFGWTDRWAYAIYSYLVTPLLAAAYVWVSLGAQRLYEGLQSSEALAAPAADYEMFTQGTLQAAYTHPGWSVAALVIAVLLGIYYTVLFRSTTDWPRYALLLRAIKVVLLYIPGWYMVCQIVARHAVTTWGLYQLFHQFEVQPHPLHPDMCGGLKAINDYAVGFTYIIILVGIGVMLQIYVTWREKGSTLSRDIVMLLAAYVIIATASFFLPLWTAHTAMHEAKQAQLDEIAKNFQAGYVELTTQLDNAGEPLDEPIERLEDLKTLYEMTEAFPVWPLDMGTLSRFAATVIVPLLPLAIEGTISLLRKKAGLQKEKPSKSTT